MKYFLDTEFIECAKQRAVLGFKVGAVVPTIDLISIALVAEDGRELYLLNADCELGYAWANEWVRKNVLYPIYREYVNGDMQLHCQFSLSFMRGLFKQKGLHRPALSWEILKFVQAEAYEGWVGSAEHFFGASFEDEHQFYGYYSGYDWVVFCQLFGRMNDLPKGFPMYCIDLKQEQDRLGITKEQKRLLCPDPVNEHSALADARWNKKLFAALKGQAARIN